MNTYCCFMVVMSVLAVCGVACIIALLVLVCMIHSDLRDIHRTLNNE